MNPELLGKRIREARLAKKMTQSEVVGTYITRNMLSLIESGNANPSLETLEFLAKVLGLTVAELIAETPEDYVSKLTLAKREFMAENYRKVIEILETPKETDPLFDEYCAILARAYAKLEGEQEKAEHYKSLGIYAE